MILLPCWVQILEDLASNVSLSDPLAVRVMPRDVATRWNSTFNMLIFALQYREAIDEISVDREMRKYELSDEEWKLVQQLCSILAVRCAAHWPIPVTHIFSDIQGRDPFLFMLDAKSCHRDTCNGSH
jgi:hypothetical protein